MRIGFGVRLSEADVLLAQKWADAVMSSGIENRANYAGTMRADRYFIGYLGELAVARMFDAYGVAYAHRVSLVGASAPSEFIVIELDGAQARVEVKTSGEPTHRRLMWPDAQHDKAATYIVGARVERIDPCCIDMAVIGWITRGEADELPVSTFGTHNIPTRFVEYERTGKVIDLIDRLVSVRRVLRVATRK